MAYTLLFRHAHCDQHRCHHRAQVTLTNRKLGLDGDFCAYHGALLATLYSVPLTVSPPPAPRWIRHLPGELYAG